MFKFLVKFSNKIIGLLIILGSAQSVFAQENNPINWLGFEEAVALQEQEGNSKKIFIDKKLKIIDD